MESIKAGQDAAILVLFKRIERFCTIITSSSFLEFQNLEPSDLEHKEPEPTVAQSESGPQKEVDVESNFSLNLLRHDTGLYVFI